MGKVVFLWLLIMAILTRTANSSTPTHPPCSDSDATTETCNGNIDAAATSSQQSDAPLTPSLPLAQLTMRRSKDRGHADLGWLNSYHTFSFSNYQDGSFDHFHSLRVINEDRVKGGEGFGKHPHSNFEIFSYIISGALKHEDSLGNLEILRRSDIQFTSAGTGIQHSEFNADSNEFVHFLQIWVIPDQNGLQPSYSTRTFLDQEKLNQLRLILSPTGINNSITLHTDINVYACILGTGSELTFELPRGREGYIHLIQDVSGFDSEFGATALRVNGGVLRGGDGAYVRHNPSVASDGVGSRIRLKGASTRGSAEFILFDIKMTDQLKSFRH